MNNAEDARRKLAGAPAELRLAVLFSPRTRRAALTALFAVYLEIREILNECSDASVARTKLAWWQEEISLFAQRQARHPLTINLVRHLPMEFPPTALLMEIVESTATDVSPPTFQRFEDVERYCQYRGGALLQLAAAFAGTRQAATLQVARDLGIAWQLADIVIQTGANAARGRVYLAARDLYKHDLSQHIVAGMHTETGLKALLDDYAQRAQAYAGVSANYTGVESETLSAAYVLSSLAKVRLKQFAARGYDTTQAPVELRPFTRLLTAWRAARLSRTT